MRGVTTLGLILLILGALVAVVEAHYPTHGIAGGVGVAVMAIGAVLAISGLGAGVLLGLLGGLTLAGVGGAGVYRHHVPAAVDAMIQRGEFLTSWNACRSPSIDDELLELARGDRVVVERLTGLTLSVRPAEEWELI